MDELMQKIIDTHNVTESEALTAIGIMSMIAYNDKTIDSAYDIINDNIRAIVQNTLMA